MRATKLILSAMAFIVAFVTSSMTLLLGVSRSVNAPPGVEVGLWAAIFVAAVGFVGAVLVFFLPHIATAIFGVAVGLTIGVIPPENDLPVMLYALSSVLALAATFTGYRSVEADVAQRSTRT